MSKKTALLALILILILVNWSIYAKEKQLKDGRIVYLELAPVDPRSLMQGDYMALRFKLAASVAEALPKKKDSRQWRRNIDAADGYAVVSLDDRRIGTFKAIYKDQPLTDNEILMRYRVRHNTVKFATNAFFFQEGTAKVYQPARYGRFRVDDSGELLLTALYDKDLHRLEPEKEGRRM